MTGAFLARFDRRDIGRGVKRQADEGGTKSKQRWKKEKKKKRGGFLLRGVGEGGWGSA